LARWRATNCAKPAMHGIIYAMGRIYASGNQDFLAQAAGALQQNHSANA
jgi:hypothetical protein